MYSFVDATKKLYEQFFNYCIKSLELKNDNFLYVIWILFAYFKKVILKRKNDVYECVSLISIIFDLLKTDIRELNSKAELYLGDFEVYVNELSANLKISQNSLKWKINKIQIEAQTRKKIEEILLPDTLDNNLQNNSLFFNINFNLLFELYYKTLIPDEIDDNKIFVNYFTDRKFKHTPMKSKILNYHSSTFSNAYNSLQSTANSQRMNYNNPSSPLYLHTPSPIKIISSPASNTNSNKPTLENFLEETYEYDFLEISYLFKKFAKFHIENKVYFYNQFFEDFDLNFISLFLNKLEDKLECKYKDHKNLYLKLFEELLLNEKPTSDGFNSILNDQSFHQNFLIISFFVYFNLLLVEKNTLLVDLEYAYTSRLNDYEKFDFINSFKIVTDLMKIPLPLEIKSILRKYQNLLITYVIWREKSFAYRQYLNASREEISIGALDQNEQIKFIRNVMKKVYTHTCFIIDRVVKYSALDSTIREKAWLVMKFIFSNEPSYIKDQYLDSLIINILSKFVLTANLTDRYREIQKNINPQLFEKLFKESNTKLAERSMPKVVELIQQISQSQTNSYYAEKLFNPVYDLMYLDLNFSKCLHYLTEDYNVILSMSPDLIKSRDQILYNSCRSNDSSVDYLGQKRIRQLTPTSSKVLTLSPYNNKYSSFHPMSNSAFKNLNTVFSSLKKEKENI